MVYLFPATLYED